MKKIITSLLICLFIHQGSVAAALGEERIEPLRFPKFTIAGEYALMRTLRAFNGSGVKSSLNNSTGINLHSEAGLMNFLNGGFSFSFTRSKPAKKGSNIGRMALFLKPYLPIGERFSLFGRFSFGPSISILNESYSPKIRGEIKFDKTYGQQQYDLLSGGLNGSATIGLEAFITSRLGLVAEWGIRADMLWAGNITESGYKKPPNWFHYLIYDTPIMVGVHFIL